jgi:hypothetical protein
MYLEIDKEDEDDLIHHPSLFSEESASSSQCIARYFSLILLILSLLIVPVSLVRLLAPSSSLVLQQQYTSIKNCSSNEILEMNFGHLPSWRYDLISINSHENPDRKVNFPVYMSQDMNAGLPLVKYVYIIQHGNLRNGYDYYCSAMNSLSETDWDMSQVLVISPQFLVENDTCWQDDQSYMINVDHDVTCNLPIWSSEGWKDGHFSRTHPSLFSYDVFDDIINFLGEISMFPKLQVISFFGFSAGGQVTLRYAAMPGYSIDSNRIKTRFIVSDPSTYLYLDRRRPFTNESHGYGIPDASWLRPEWQVGS